MPARRPSGAAKPVRATEAAPLDGAELVAACLAGDADAYARLVDRHGPVAAMVARRTIRARGATPREEDVEDVVEATFLALLQDDGKLLRTYDARFALSTYVGVIARTHVGRLLRRKNHPQLALDGVDVEGRERDPLVSAADGELRALVADVLEELSPRDRDVLIRFYFHDEDYQAIAAALEVSPNTVGAVLHRARTRLKKRLEERGEVPDLS